MMKYLVLLAALLSVADVEQTRIRSGTQAAGGGGGGGTCDAANVATGASNCPLLTWSDFAIEGYYKLPGIFDDTLYFGGLSMKYGDPTKLWATTGFYVTELSIPAIVNSGSTGSLNTASYVQGTQYVDVNGDSNDGKFCDDVDCENTTGAYISSVLDDGNYVYVGGFPYFQASPSKDYGLFRISRTLASFSYPGAVKGWDGDGLVTTTQAFVSQYCGLTPTEWVTALGNTAYCGASSSFPIISRTTNGPSIVMLDQTQINTTTVTGQGLLYYLDSANTLGTYACCTTPSIWSSTAGIGGCSMINGTRTLVCIGNNGTGTDYGSCYGTSPTPPGDCGIPMIDLEYQGIAYHAPPYIYKYWLFDLNDLKAVKDGTGGKTHENITPYDHGTFSTLYTPDRHRFVGLTYDPTNHRLQSMAMRIYGFQNGLPLMVSWTVDVSQ